MEINCTKQVKVNAKTLKIYSKVVDNFTCTIFDQDGQRLGGQDQDYVPGFMPGEHYGDYLILDIDLDTGKILNWKQPTAEAIEEYLESHGEGNED